ncbi:MAG: metal-dependent transcriptional regulator [Acidobacteriia bacterium]|nr:metal-dependent transcriptional regulator [Terriglobia bacterium]
MSHHKDLAGHEIEELAETLWHLEEGGTDRLEDLRRESDAADLDALLGRARELGLAEVADGGVILTAQGRELAERQVRRHRLAELLLSTVLEVGDEQAVERSACVMEHVLGAAVTDSVCAFLGHPKFCPHGRPIPSGRCCRSFSNAIEPLVQPLARLAVGSTARIVYIVPRDAERLVRLSTLGVVPGATLKLQQKAPATVLRIGETTLAVDPEISGEIFVKRFEE